MADIDRYRWPRDIVLASLSGIAAQGDCAMLGNLA